MTLHKVLCIITVWASFATSARAGEPAELEAGPENGGLRLRLVVKNHLATRGSLRTVRLELVNVSRQPVTLVSQWSYEKPTGDYSKWLRYAVEFTTVPEVETDAASTTGETRTSPQSKQELKSGETLTIHWTENGRVLKFPDRDFEEHENTGPTLPSAGMYFARARFTAVTADGKRLLLISNEQPIIIDGKKTLPKFATSEVLSANAKNKTVQIRLGSDHRIERGDKFYLRDPADKSIVWQLTISRTETWWSEGTVAAIAANTPAAAPFPQQGWHATLIP